MRILAIETAANVAAVAVKADGRLICEECVNNKKTHSETLMVMIDRSLKNSGIGIKDIDLIAVSNGPGSFTGLRIGVSTAKGLAHALGIPIVGVSTLKSVAYNFPFCEYIISPIMDARRHEVYNALYRWKNGVLTEIAPPRAISVDGLTEELLKTGEKIVFAGDGAPVYQDILKEKMGDMALFSPSCCGIQKAAAMADIAGEEYLLGNARSSYETGVVYLRKSQAEREADEKERKKEQ